MAHVEDYKLCFSVFIVPMIKILFSHYTITNESKIKIYIMYCLC